MSYQLYRKYYNSHGECLDEIWTRLEGDNLEQLIDVLRFLLIKDRKKESLNHPNVKLEIKLTELPEF